MRKISKSELVPPQLLGALVVQNQADTELFDFSCILCSFQVLKGALVIQAAFLACSAIQCRSVSSGSVCPIARGG